MQIKSICDGIIRKLCFMFKSIWSNRDVSSGCRLLIKTFRFVYIVFAIYYVGDSMYSTFKKYKEGRIVVSITEEDYQQRVYPSITFCSKFTNGQNSALTPYFDILFEKAKQSGCILDNLELVGGDLPNMPQLVEDYRKCNKLCKETPKCKLWQLTEGFCYLKNEAGKLKPGGYLAVSGSRNCNSTSSCVYNGMEFWHGDLWAEWANSFDHCRNICLDHSSCQKWTYYVPDNLKWCYLKTENISRVSECKNCVSGVRYFTTQLCNKEFVLNHTGILDPWQKIKQPKSSIMSEFKQRFVVSNACSIDVLMDEKLWTESIPHEDSGPCYTYNPPAISDPGWYYGIEMKPNVVSDSGNWDKDLEIFLHEEGKIFYFKEAAPPNNIRIHINTLRNMNHSMILVKISTTHKLSQSNHPCNDDQHYNHFKCLESYFYTKRGCQYPWNSYKELNLPNCENFAEIKRDVANQLREFGAHRQYYTNSERTTRTQDQCPLPCNITSYDLKYLVNFEGPGKSLKITFSDFRVEHKDEYLSCDKTCIIGEIGGNLGFFLGGSILIFFDLLITQVDRVQSLVHGKWFRPSSDE